VIRVFLSLRGHLDVPFFQVKPARTAPCRALSHTRARLCRESSANSYRNLVCSSVRFATAGGSLRARRCEGRPECSASAFSRVLLPRNLRSPDMFSTLIPTQPPRKFPGVDQIGAPNPPPTDRGFGRRASRGWTYGIIILDVPPANPIVDRRHSAPSSSLQSRTGQDRTGHCPKCFLADGKYLYLGRDHDQCRRRVRSLTVVTIRPADIPGESKMPMCGAAP
jgi:hypothetical protein